VNRAGELFEDFEQPIWLTKSNIPKMVYYVVGLYLFLPILDYSLIVILYSSKLAGVGAKVQDISVTEVSIASKEYTHVGTLSTGIPQPSSPFFSQYALVFMSFYS
jgi:hypothetical protein